MAWRNRGVTGSNNTPLGNRRRFGDDADDSADSREAAPDAGSKRGRSPMRELNPDGTKRRRKRNRWGDAQENKAAGLMGLPTAIMANMTSEQLDAYTLHLRIEEISQKLRINDVVPADGDRSPSPPPQYDNMGRRTNTRDARYRKRLEDERHKLIDKAMKTIPNYHPPSDYRRPTKTQEKVYVPVNDYPEINFIGLIIGPRGNTLKKMETESGAKIAIRGKGSVKEGKGRSDAAHTSNQEEDLHCLIMADTEDKVNKAKKLINQIIETAASIPEGQNELKRNQLRELAALNGTLRDDENQACQNCGQIGHRKYDCPEQRNFTANIICRVCGNAGHMARDCPDRQKGTDWNNGPPARPAAAAAGRPGDAADREYESLMQELSGGGGGGSGRPQGRIEAGSGGYGGEQGGGGGSGAAPWRSAPTGGAAPWSRPREANQDDLDSGTRPWAPQAGQGESNSYAAYGQGYGQGAAAPWQQGSGSAAAGGQQGAYGGYDYSAYAAAYAAAAAAAPGTAAAPGMAQYYAAAGAGGAPPPPPPPGDEPPPPPPPSDVPPPPPPPPM